MIDRRNVLEGFVGLGIAAVWPACRSKEETVAEPARGIVAQMPPRRLAALSAATERILPGAIAAGAIAFIDYWLRRPAIENLRHKFEIGALLLNRTAQKQHRKLFAESSGEEQDEVLREFHAGTVHPKFDGRGFFEQLVTFTLESFLGDPKYGGNHGRVGWTFIDWDPCWWSPKRVGQLLERDERLPY